MNVSVVAEPQLPALAEEWDALADRAGTIPFVRPGYVQAWWDAFADGSLEVLAARRGSELVGTLPLHRTKAGLRTTTNWETPGFRLLATDDEARAALLATALRLAGPSLELQHLEAGQQDLPVAREALRALGFRAHGRSLERSPYVAIPDELFEPWAKARLGSKLAADLRRRRRKLDAEGIVEIVVEDGSERLQQLLDEGYAVEGSGWKTSQDTDIASRPEARRFYDGLARWAVGRGILRLAFLRLDGRALAFQYGIEDDGAYFFCKGGIDPGSHAFAPGKLLVQHMLERAFASRLQTFEFLGDAETWKVEWTDDVRERVLVQAYPRSVRGTAAWIAEAKAKPLARQLGVRRLKRVLKLVRR